MNDYTARINRVIDYIDQNMEKNLTLDELARIAAFSKYHFHRLFCAFTGETLFQFIGRIRLEKAALLLSSRPDLSITEIGLECGFSGSASFSKSFRNYFNCSPSQWRKKNCGFPSDFSRSGVSHPALSKTTTDGTLSSLSPTQSVPQQNSNLGKQVSNEGKDSQTPMPYIHYENGMQIWKAEVDGAERVVTVKDFPPMSLAYIRYTGPYKGDGTLFQNLWHRLLTWAGTRNLITEKSLFLALYHDSPELTDERLLRVTIALSVDRETGVSGEVGKMELEGGRYACTRFLLGEKDYQAAWEWVYSDWFPVSGYLPDDRPAFEFFPRESDERKQCSEKHLVDLCVPVVPAE